MARKLVFARSKNLERAWPFVPEALSERLKSLGELEVVQVEVGRILNGKAPHAPLSREAIAVRDEIEETPPM